MTLNSTRRRLVAGALLAAVVLASFAPAAQAGQGWGSSMKHRRDGRGPHVFASASYSPRPFYVVHRSSPSALPLIAGFIGGLALGATLHSPPAYAEPVSRDCVPEPAYYYYDPYCDERFSSLDIYLSHLHHGGRHPGIVRVIDAGTGDCVRVLRRYDGAWQDWNDDDQGDEN